MQASCNVQGVRVADARPRSCVLGCRLVLVHLAVDSRAAPYSIGQHWKGRITKRYGEYLLSFCQYGLAVHRGYIQSRATHRPYQVT